MSCLDAWTNCNGTTTAFSTDGYFPATVTNPLLQTIITEIDPREGNPTQVTDAITMPRTSRSGWPVAPR